MLPEDPGPMAQAGDAVLSALTRLRDDLDAVIASVQEAGPGGLAVAGEVRIEDVVLCPNAKGGWDIFARDARAPDMHFVGTEPDPIGAAVRGLSVWAGRWCHIRRRAWAEEKARGL